MKLYEGRKENNNLALGKEKQVADIFVMINKVAVNTQKSSIYCDVLLKGYLRVSIV